MTPDFLATSHSVTSRVRDVNQFMSTVRAHRHSILIMILQMFLTLGWHEASRILTILQRDVDQSDVRSMATEEFFGTAPIKFGPYAVKFSVKAVSTTAKTIERPSTENFLREELAERLRKDDLIMDFKLQFYADDTSTPIEDTSVLWQTESLTVAPIAHTPRRSGRPTISQAERAGKRALVLAVACDGGSPSAGQRDARAAARL
ncbi:MAG: hypothetical protein ABI561_14015 [Bradyrhizobium sp.]